MIRRSQLTTRRVLLLAGAAFAILVLIAAFFVTSHLQQTLASRLGAGGALPSVEIFAPEIPLRLGRRFERERFEAESQTRGWQVGRDFLTARGDECKRLGPQSPALDFAPEAQCYYIRDPGVLLSLDGAGFVGGLWRGDPLLPTTEFDLFPRLVTQIYDGQPILRQTVSLAEIPLACLEAVTAIEDREFLEHRGVSPTGTLRALLRNLRQRRWAEGGSTITQQLVKNFFLTPKKTLRRKLEEQALALLLEGQLSKDQILELYLNVIYMGQSGPFQVRGFGSAAQYYFGKPVGQLELEDCALLAALINNPGRYNPVSHAESARARRELVLAKMDTLGMIGVAEKTRALAAPLPASKLDAHRISAPYYALAVQKEFGLAAPDIEGSVKLSTALDRDVQTQISMSIERTLPLIEKRIRHPGHSPLQTAVVTIDLQSNHVIGLVGGRDYKQTQFNRVVDSRRQIGSIIKPFVYYPAFKTGNALSSVSDAPFEWKTGRQTWRPRNFEKEFKGDVPYFYALAESLNVPAARVGQMVGLKEIRATLNNSGLEESAPLVPALTLGALELTPLSVAQLYSTLGRMGRGERVHALVGASVESQGAPDHPLILNAPDEHLRLDPPLVAQVIGMMEQTFALGTARSATAQGLQGEYAGKTGTTSDTKDAWFAGFDGRLLTVVWVGYDDNEPMGLTGAGAALPIWTDIMKRLQSIYAPQPFVLPEGVERRAVSREDILKDFPAVGALPESLNLIFAKSL